MIATGGNFLDAGDAVDIENTVEHTSLLGAGVTIVEKSAAFQRKPIFWPLFVVFLHQPATFTVENFLRRQLDTKFTALVAVARRWLLHATVAIGIASFMRLRTFPIIYDLLWCGFLLDYRNYRRRWWDNRQTLRSLLFGVHFVASRSFV